MKYKEQCCSELSSHFKHFLYHARVVILIGLSPPTKRCKKKWVVKIYVLCHSISRHRCQLKIGSFMKTFSVYFPSKLHLLLCEPVLLFVFVLFFQKEMWPAFPKTAHWKHYITVFYSSTEKIMFADWKKEDQRSEVSNVNFSKFSMVKYNSPPYGYFQRQKKDKISRVV